MTLVTKSTSGLLIERILLQRNVRVVQQVNWDGRSLKRWGAHHTFVQKCSNMHAMIGCFLFYAYSTWNNSSQMGLVATKLWIGIWMMFQSSLRWKKLLSMRCHRMLQWACYTAAAPQWWRHRFGQKQIIQILPTPTFCVLTELWHFTPTPWFQACVWPFVGLLVISE